MEKRVFLAILLCVGVFAFWQKYYMAPLVEAQRAYQVQQASIASQSSDVNLHSSGEKSTVIAPMQAKTVSGEVVTLHGEKFSFDVSTLGGAVKNQQIPSFRGQNTENVSRLIAGEEEYLISSNSADWQYLEKVPFSITSQSADKVALQYEDQNVKIHRQYEVVPNQFAVKQNISLQFKRQPLPPFVFIQMRTAHDLGKIENEKRELIINKSKDQSLMDLSGIKEAKDDLGEIHWFGFASRYFLNAILDTNAVEGKAPQFQVRPDSRGVLTANLVYPVKSETLNFNFLNYFGPKYGDDLKVVHPRLGSAIDFGVFTVFAYPLLQGLKWIHGFVGNFGLAIILLTLVVKLMTFPLTHKSMKSMKEMQRIQPQLAKLREKYADDKEQLNREMMQLMKSNGYNPMSGCLPIFIQMPIYIALYNVLNNSIELYGQPFFGWIHDLSQKDPYFVTPVLLGLIMFVQQKMTPNTSTDPAQQKMMMFMPVMFGAMMLWLPSGLTLYMLVNTLTSVVQQVVINRQMNPATA